MAQCEMPELRVLDVALPLLGGALVFGLTLFLVAKYYIGVEDDTITERVVTENANVERANSTSLATVKDQNGHLSYLLYPSILVLLASTWYQQVNSAVREPYLVRGVAPLTIATPLTSARTSSFTFAKLKSIVTQATLRTGIPKSQLLQDSTSSLMFCISLGKAVTSPL